MDKKLFNSLMDSVREAGDISKQMSQGEMPDNYTQLMKGYSRGILFTCMVTYRDGKPVSVDPFDESSKHNDHMLYEDDFMENAVPVEVDDDE